MGLNQHDAPLWARRKGQKVTRLHALRSLENDDVRGRHALRSQAAGATRRFLPAYSPDLDPIEQVFAKLKNTLRKMAHRTVDALWEGIGIALDDFPPNECLNYFRNAGYGSA